MKIAQVAPLFESVPPHLYGGTERIVHYLTEELIHQGHEVTLFASGDSITNARLVTCVNRALRLSQTYQDAVPLHLLLLERLLSEIEDYDIVHFHLDFLHFPLMRRLAHYPSLTTLHGRLDLPEHQMLLREYEDLPLVSISDNQRLPAYWANWQGTVYHGLPTNLYHFQAQSEPYLVFIGRFSPEKRLDRAVEIARLAQMRLIVAAKIDEKERKYYEKDIKELLKQPHVEYIGEVGEAEKQELLGSAQALLFPIDWPEPFGLVMIEAMACGTPVIAFSNGSVPEVIDHGISGYIVHSIEQAVEAAHRCKDHSRQMVRITFERRFSVTTMADNYLKIFRNRIDDSEGVYRFKSGSQPTGVDHPWRRPI